MSIWWCPNHGLYAGQTLCPTCGGPGVFATFDHSFQESKPMSDAEKLAQFFHETYERLAPKFDYKTREASAKPWADVPEPNKSLMIAVCEAVLNSDVLRQQADKRRIEGLEKGLRPLAEMKLTTEPEISDCLLRSAGEELRIRATKIDARDDAIRTARALLEGQSNHDRS